VSEEISLLAEVKVLASLAAIFVVYTWAGGRIAAHRFRPSPPGPERASLPVRPVSDEEEPEDAIFMSRAA
jgi:hypothetical protein